MNPLWTIADLIDLHFFSGLDDELMRTRGEAHLAKRDRLIYLAKIEPRLGKADDIPPRLLVRRWLTMRRLQYRREQAAEGAPLPGTVWREMALLSQGLLFLCGLFAGIGLAGSLLLYTGATPLNVSVYFGLFVGVQLALIGLQGLLLGYRRLRRLSLESSVLYLLLGRVLIRGLDGLRRWLYRTMTGRQRLDLAALAGSVRQRKELAALLIWPGFVLVQLGGIGFNLGVIGATLAKVAFADIAFAWQSSLQFSPDLVAGLVQWIAWPWSWIVPQAVPTLAQIQGSQMVLKEGAVHLATVDLVAWWPFLCCAVVVYGLLPRCLLLVLGLMGQRRALAQLHFATLDLRPLLHRMTAPRIDTNGVREVKPSEEKSTATPKPTPVTRVVPKPAPVVEGVGWLFVLIPDELDGDALRSALLVLLRPEFGTDRFEWIRQGVPGLTEAETLAPLGAAAVNGTLAGVLLLHEAWQPPLRETEGLLHDLRQAVGERIPLTILLVGRPANQTVLTPVEPESFHVWTRKMQGLGDPWLTVRPLVQP